MRADGRAILMTYNTIFIDVYVMGTPVQNQRLTGEVLQ